MTTPPEFVSILLRTRDRPLFLARALDDVLAQTWRDWRLILVNDGGAQAEVERAVSSRETSFAGRVTVLHHPQARGHGAALNAALDASTGRYFAVHDDDDTWHPDFLSETVTLMEDPAHAGLAGVATDCTLVREQVRGGAIFEMERVPWPLFRDGVDIADMLVRNRIPPISILLRRDIASRAGPYDPTLTALEDWEFFLRMLMYADIATIGTVLAFYHIRPDVSGGPEDNTVVAGSARHDAQALLIGNRALRQAMRDEPALIGVLRPVLQRLDAQERMLSEMRHDLDHRLAHLEEMMTLVHLTAAWHHKLLAPVQRIWSAARRLGVRFRR